MDTIICKELILSTIKRRGEGTEDSPIRIIREVYEKDGTKIAENDPYKEKFSAIDLINFSIWVKNMGYNPNELKTNAVIKWQNDIKND